MGGINGHLNHPYDIAKDGKELIQLFEDAIEDISKKRSTLKIDGISMSVRLNDDGKFVIDRGSNKDLDKKGVRQEDLEERFGAGHGLVKIGKIILDLFDSVQDNIKKELAALGITTGSGVILNFEFVDKKTNIINYSNRLLIVHGIKKENSTEEEKRSFLDVKLYNQLLLKNLFVAFNKYSNTFKMTGDIVVGAEKSNDIDISKVLDTPLTLNGNQKSLIDWLEETKIDLPMITREEYRTIDESPKVNLSNKELDDYIIYYATIKIGDVILKSLGLDKHEGLVVNGKNKFKITGSFIIKNLESPFALMKEDQKIEEILSMEAYYDFWGWIIGNNVNIGKAMLENPNDFKGRLITPEMKFHSFKSESIPTGSVYIPIKADDESNNYYTHALFYSELDAPSIEELEYMREKNFMGYKKAWSEKSIRFYVEKANGNLFFQAARDIDSGVLLTGIRTIQSLYDKQPSSVLKTFPKFYRQPEKIIIDTPNIDIIVDYNQSSLSKIRNKIASLNEETNNNKQVVIIPGGFQPFHPGHGIDLKEQLMMEPHYKFWGWILDDMQIGEYMFTNPKDLRNRIITPQLKYQAMTRRSIVAGSLYIANDNDRTNSIKYYHHNFFGDLLAQDTVDFLFKNESYSPAYKAGAFRFSIEDDTLYIQNTRKNYNKTALLTGVKTLINILNKPPEKIVNIFPKIRQLPTLISLELGYARNYISIPFGRHSLANIRNKILGVTEETNTNKQVVIIPGGFHPIHPGHLSLYQKAKEDFPDARVILAATNKTNTRPFKFADKVFLANIIGIPEGDVILVNNPLDKKEMEELFPGKDLIFIRGNKEVRMKNLKIKYYPIIKFKVLDKKLSSATQIRDLYVKSDEKTKKKILLDLYGYPLTNKIEDIFFQTLNNNKAKK